MEKSFETCVAEGALSEIESLRIYEQKIYKKYSPNFIFQEHPTAIILGGQNASGKSTLGKRFLLEYESKGGIVGIEGDALRDYHPNFKQYNRENDKLMAAYTTKDSGRWTERLIEDTARNKCNMIIETTLRNKETVTGTVEKLSNAGYDVQAKIFVVSYDKSLLGAYMRYEKLKAERGAGRFVYDNALKAAYNGMPETIQALKEQGKCSCIHLYTREGVLFDGDYRQTDILSILKKERCREYTPNEIQFVQEGWKRVDEYMKSRGASKEEYKEIARRMADRIDIMVDEGVASRNIRTMNDIYINEWFPKTQNKKTDKNNLQNLNLEQSENKIENKLPDTFSKTPVKQSSYLNPSF